MEFQAQFSFFSTFRMIIVSFPSSLNYCNKIIPDSLQPTSQASNNSNKFSVPSRSLCKTSYSVDNFFSLPFSCQPVIKTNSSSRWHRGLSLVPFDGKSSSRSDEEDHRALETVLKLYSAIKNQNIRELSDIIGDECRCVCNFFSFFQPFQGKKQVLEFFTHLIGSLGNNIEFVVKPTLHDGMNVGIAWKLEWGKTHVPLGKGFSFYICQIYQGKVLIRNVEMFMEPLLHIDPFRLKFIGYMTAMVDQLTSYTMPKEKKRALLLVIFFLILLVLFSKPGFY